MRTIIAGSRENVTYQDLLNAIEECGWVPTVVISGTARGGDLLGERWGLENKVPIERFPAQWNINGKFDRAAGIKRNIKMAESAEALIAIWDGESKGTQHMIRVAMDKDLKVHVYLVEK